MRGYGEWTGYVVWCRERKGGGGHVVWCRERNGFVGVASLMDGRVDGYGW